MSLWLISWHDIAYGIEAWLILHLLLWTAFKVLKVIMGLLEHRFVNTWWDRALFTHGLARYETDHHQDILACKNQTCILVRR